MRKISKAVKGPGNEICKNHKLRLIMTETETSLTFLIPVIVVLSVKLSTVAMRRSDLPELVYQNKEWENDTGSDDFGITSSMKNDSSNRDALDFNGIKSILNNKIAYLKRKWDDWQIIFPGTKWCGNGNIASGEKDLGRLKHVDMCCRDHDHCNVVIPGTQMRWGLKNYKSYSISGCHCDNAFYKCMKQTVKNQGFTTEGIAARLVGTLFFNLLKMPCVKLPPNANLNEKPKNLPDVIENKDEDEIGPPAPPPSNDDEPMNDGMPSNLTDTDSMADGTKTTPKPKAYTVRAKHWKKFHVNNHYKILK